MNFSHSNNHQRDLSPLLDGDFLQIRNIGHLLKPRNEILNLMKISVLPVLGQSIWKRSLFFLHVLEGYLFRGVSH